MWLQHSSLNEVKDDETVAVYNNNNKYELIGVDNKTAPNIMGKYEPIVTDRMS